MLNLSEELRPWRKKSTVSTTNLVDLATREAQSSPASALDLDNNPTKVVSIYSSKCSNKDSVNNHKNEPRSRFYKMMSFKRTGTDTPSATGICNEGFKESVSRSASNKTDVSETSDEDCVFLKDLSNFSAEIEEMDWPNERPNHLKLHRSNNIVNDNSTAAVASLEILSQRGLVSSRVGEDKDVRTTAAQSEKARAQPEEMRTKTSKQPSRRRNFSTSCKMESTTPQRKKSLFRSFSDMRSNDDKNRLCSKSSIFSVGHVTSTIGSFHGSKVIEAVNDGFSNHVDNSIFLRCDFPFDNLVFEGGGNKGTAYVGALQVLEEAGIMKKIKRVAGASVGAVIASLVALGFTSQDLKEFMDQDLRKVLVDHRCGYCSLLPNLLQGFGWNPGKRLLKWFGEQLRERTGNADITFKELLHQFGRELCIVVTNLSQMSTEYFHPKTTPNTPIRTAVRMSVAMPGVFQSVLYKVHENTDVYVDGGLLCNYPIHAFDGWWLSMEPKDSFFQKLQPLEEFPRLFSKSERFGKWNNKTLGIILYSHTETELMKTILKARQGSNPPRQPNTKLYRKRRKMRMKQQAAQMEHQAVVSAVGKLIKELRALHIDDDGVINEREMEKLFSKSSDFTVEDKLLLFGSTDSEKAFAELDTDEDGEITFQELLSFLERKGVGIQTRFLGYTRREINHLSDFISTLQTALSINVKRNYVEDRDAERTVGIDTDYIETNDYELEQEDKDFLIETGARATRAFLRDFAKKHPECRRRGSAMLSKTFFESPRFQRKFASSDNNNTTSDAERRTQKESTSTAMSFISSDSAQTSPIDLSSSFILRHNLSYEDESDLGIPGAYR